MRSATRQCTLWRDWRQTNWSTTRAASSAVCAPRHLGEEKGGREGGRERKRDGWMEGGIERGRAGHREWRREGVCK